jgi:hypothetical protein
MRWIICYARPITIAAERRWVYGRRTIEEARHDRAAWPKKWSSYPKLCDWVESSIEETPTFYRMARLYQKNQKSTNLLEQLMGEIKRCSCGAHFPESGGVFTADAHAVGRDARELSRGGAPLGYGISDGTQEGANDMGGMKLRSSLTGGCSAPSPVEGGGDARAVLAGQEFAAPR